jgi:uncharacterized protein (DUF433 family)
MSYARITARPDQLDGIPCIRNLRIPVAAVVRLMADGMGDSEILAAYPDLEAEDIREAIRYAAETVQERELPLTGPGNGRMGLEPTLHGL